MMLLGLIGVVESMTALKRYMFDLAAHLAHRKIATLIVVVAILVVGSSSRLDGIARVGLFALAEPLPT